MAQPKPNHSATHSLDAKGKTAPRNAREAMPPGGPIKPNPMTFKNPGPTDNLRGVEPNTAHHKGTPNPPQMGTRHGEMQHHDPGMGAAGDSHGHGVPLTKYLPIRHSDVSTKTPPPNPGDVAK